MDVAIKFLKQSMLAKKKIQNTNFMKHVNKEKYWQILTFPGIWCIIRELRRFCELSYLSKFMDSISLNYHYRVKEPALLIVKWHANKWLYSNYFWFLTPNPKLFPLKIFFFHFTSKILNRTLLAPNQRDDKGWAI